MWKSDQDDTGHQIQDDTITCVISCSVVQFFVVSVSVFGPNPLMLTGVCIYVCLCLGGHPTLQWVHPGSTFRSYS